MASAIKQVIEGVSGAIKGAWAAKGTIGSVAAVGSVAAAGAGVGVLNSVQRNQQFRREENPYNPQNFKNQGFWQRQSTVASIGMLGQIGQGGGPGNPMGGFKALWDYNTQRAADVYMTSGLPGGANEPVGRMARTGMIAGGALGMATGLAASAFTKLPMTKTVLGLGALGAAAGGYNTRKVSLQVMESVNQARKSSMNRNKVQNRVRTQGSGFRSWTRGNRMGRPGHLGMSGSTPFAMHKARRRSTV